MQATGSSSARASEASRLEEVISVSARSFLALMAAGFLPSSRERMGRALTLAAAGSAVLVVLTGCASAEKAGTELTHQPTPATPIGELSPPPGEPGMANAGLFAISFDAGSASEQVVLSSEGQDPLPSLPEATRRGIDAAAADAGCAVVRGQALAGRMRLEVSCALDEPAAAALASALREVPEVSAAEPELVASAK